jgi:hypothetical protein
MKNLTLLDTQPVPKLAVPGPVELTFSTSAWKPTQHVDVSYSILNPNVSFPDDTDLKGIAVPDRTTPVTCDTRFQLVPGTTAPQSFKVQAQVVDNGMQQFTVTWIIKVTS